MISRLLAAVLCVGLSIAGSVNAQPALKPHIGLNALPQDSDPVCDAPLYLGTFDSTGYQAGDTVNDFTLYTLSGDSVRLSSELANGRPKLLIGGSYTCPYFRNKVPAINWLVGMYGGLLDVYVVYTVEAHPVGSPSPYFGTENITTQNQQQNILLPQPATYGERKAMAQTAVQQLGLNATVLMDGTCNEWWLSYGPAPANATLVDVNGIVVAKHAWFNQYPMNMACALDSLLGTAFGNCNTGSPTGQFTLVLGPDTVAGPAGETLTSGAWIVNSGSEPVYVEVKRMQQDIPAGWATSMCLDVCYTVATSTANVLVAPGDTQLFTLYFFNTPAPGIGNVTMKFRNANNTANQITHIFTAVTKPEIETTLTTYVVPGKFNALPNPSANTVHLNRVPASLYDATGRLLLSTAQPLLDVSGLAPGVYFIRHDNETVRLVRP